MTKEEIIKSVKDEIAKKYGYKDYEDAFSKGDNDYIIDILEEAVDNIAQVPSHKCKQENEEKKLFDAMAYGMGYMCGNYDTPRPPDEEFDRIFKNLKVEIIRKYGI